MTASGGYRSDVERRAGVRHVVDARVEVAVGTEAPRPTARSVDVSLDGALLVFDAPVFLVPGQPVCLAIADRDQRVVVCARLARAARGIDHRTYVAVRIDARLDPVAAARWAGWVDEQSPLTATEEPDLIGR